MSTKAAAIDGLVQIVGLETEQKKRDKFNRLGNFSLISSLLELLLEEGDFETSCAIMDDMARSFS